MTTAVERFNKNIIDEDGDVRHVADADSDTILPPDNAFIIGRDYSLPGKRTLEAERQAAAEWDVIEDKNPGPHVTLEQYYQDQLELLNFVSGSLMRRGFKKGGSQTPEAIERYGADLPRVEAGAHRNHQNSVHKDLPQIYHADELIAAGFEEPEVLFDAKTQMRSEAQFRYGGPENKSKRAVRRRELKKKLAFYASK